jgi:hypothetical protein
MCMCKRLCKTADVNGDGLALKGRARLGMNEGRTADQRRDERDSG